MTKVYVTRYALTAGIFCVEAKINETGTVASYKRDESYYTECAHGKDFYLTADAALKRAEEMRIKKLQSIDKQAKRISALKFEIK